MSPYVDDLSALKGWMPTGIARFAAAATVVLLLVGWSTLWFPWSEGVVVGQSLQDAVPLVVLVIVGLAPLVALRAPIWSAAVGFSPLLLSLLGPVSMLPWVQYPALLAAGVVATRSRPVRAMVPFVASLVLVLGYVTGRWALAVPGGGSVDSSYGGRAFVEFGIYLGFTCLAVVVAHALKIDSQRQLAREARAEEVEQESTVVAERARLARDLHDVVAHHISLIAVRAETAPYTVPDLPAEARAVLAEIAEDARRSLDELRHVLGVLRRSDNSATRAPLPTLTDLPDLIEQARAAGDVIAVAGLHTSTTTHVSAAQSYVAYRVIQEALTNARRHAPGAPVSIAVAADKTGGLDLTITNPLPPTSDHAPPEGRGLLGIRERVEALGGTTRVDRTNQHTLNVLLPSLPHNRSSSSSTA